MTIVGLIDRYSGRVFHGKYALLDSQSRSLYAVLEMKFSEDAFEMILDRVLRNV